MGRLIRLLFVAAAAPLFGALVYEAWFALSMDVFQRPMLWFLVGWVCFGLCYVVIRSLGGTVYSNFHFLRILRHELGHLLAAMTLSSQAGEMVVKDPMNVTSQGGGHLQHSPHPLTPRSPIRLAPYCIPFLTIPLLFLRFLPVPWFRDLMDLLIGLTLAFHYSSVLREFTLRQPDIRRTGIIASLVLVVLANVVVLVLVKVVLTSDWPLIVTYGTRSLARAGEWYRLVLAAFARWRLDV